MIHQLQGSCGITLPLKAQGVTAEKVQEKPQELPVYENTQKEPAQKHNGSVVTILLSLWSKQRRQT